MDEQKKSIPFDGGFKPDKTGTPFTPEQIDQLCTEFETRQKNKQRPPEERRITIPIGSLCLIALLILLTGITLLEAAKIIIFGHW